MPRKKTTTDPVQDPLGVSEAGKLAQLATDLKRTYGDDAVSGGTPGEGVTVTLAPPPSGVTNGHTPDGHTPPPVATPRLESILLDDIMTGDGNPRSLFDKNGDESGQLTGLHELAESIREQGLLQPITVRPNTGDGAFDHFAKKPPTGGQGQMVTVPLSVGGTATVYRPPWLLVAGERRLRAVRSLKWTHIPAIIREDLDGKTGLEATVLENLQRRDLDPMEEARGLAMLRSKHGYNVETLSKRLGRTQDWVKGRLKLADLPAKAQEILLHTKTISLATAWTLHELTTGGPDNKGFPAAITAVLEYLQGQGEHYYGNRRSVGALLGEIAVDYDKVTPDSVVVKVRSWNYQPYFPFDVECKNCPFGAFKPGEYNNGSGYCLHLEHWRKLVGEAKEKEAEAKREKAANSAGAFTTPLKATSSVIDKTPAQKGKETRERRKRQKAEYPANAEAARRAGTMVAGMDWPDVAVLLAYTLAGKATSNSAEEEACKRHGVKMPVISDKPSAQQIAAIRKLDPVRSMRAVIEAILLTQAERKRDYEPDNWSRETAHDGVWDTYINPAAVQAADKALHTPFGEEVSTRFAADSPQGQAIAAVKEDARSLGHEPVVPHVLAEQWQRLGLPVTTIAIRCTQCQDECLIDEKGSYSPDATLLTRGCGHAPTPDLPEPPEGDLDDTDRFTCDSCGGEFSLGDLAYQDDEFMLCPGCPKPGETPTLAGPDEEDPDGVQAAAVAALDGVPEIGSGLATTHIELFDGPREGATGRRTAASPDAPVDLDDLVEA